MLQKLGTSLLITLFLVGYSPQDHGPLQLNWTEHYKAAPDDRSKFFALTALVFNYKYYTAVSKNVFSIRFSFSADINPYKSWVKLDKIRTREAKERLLRHEQGHVNINYLLMRATEKALVAKKYNRKRHKEEIQEIAGKVYTQFNELQNKYDEETMHGTNAPAQLRWDQSIGRALSTARLED